jgi:hypothetical protein
MDTVTLHAMLTGAITLDHIALKYIYAGEIADFWKQLGVGLGKYDLEFQYWLEGQRRLEELRSRYKAGDELPSLESLFD